MFNNSEKKGTIKSENHQWKLKTGWKFEAKDDIYIISTYHSAIIYYKGKKKTNCTDDPTKKTSSDRLCII